MINKFIIINKWTIASHLKSFNIRNKITPYGLNIPVLAWDRHKDVAVLIPLIVSKPFHSW
jgi:hypothetical protein